MSAEGYLAYIINSLSSRRSPDSMQILADGTEQVVYERNTDTYPFVFLGGSIDISNLAAGDTVIIRKYIRNTAGGTLRTSERGMYTGVQEETMLRIQDETSQYGVRVTLQQTAGVNRAYICEFYESTMVL